MKGFMFSVEALTAVAIILLALGIFSYSSSMTPAKTNQPQIQNQADGQMMLYFHETSVGQDSAAQEQYCEKVVTYDAVGNTLTDKSSCKVTK